LKNVKSALVRQGVKTIKENIILHIDHHQY